MTPRHRLALLDAVIEQREEELRAERDAQAAGRSLSAIARIAFELQTLRDEREILMEETL